MPELKLRLDELKNAIENAPSEEFIHYHEALDVLSQSTDGKDEELLESKIEAYDLLADLVDKDLRGNPHDDLALIKANEVMNAIIALNFRDDLDMPDAQRVMLNNINTVQEFLRYSELREKALSKLNLEYMGK